MITPNEFRKGNLLNFLFKNGDRVTKHETALTLLQIEKMESTENIGDFWEPIAHSAERLIQYGFEETNTFANPTSRMYRHRKELEIFLQGEICWFGFKHAEDKRKTVVCLKYLHQLQNLFFLFYGEELQEIKIVKDINLTEVSLLPGGDHGIGFEIPK